MKLVEGIVESWTTRHGDWTNEINRYKSQMFRAVLTGKNVIIPNFTQEMKLHRMQTMKKNIQKNPTVVNMLGEIDFSEHLFQ